MKRTIGRPPLDPETRQRRHVERRARIKYYKIDDLDVYARYEAILAERDEVPYHHVAELIAAYVKRCR